VAAVRGARAAELDEVGLVGAVLAQRIERDATRAAELQASLPALEAARAEEDEARRSALAARQALDEALAAATSRRSTFEVGVAALEERRRVLEERLAEIERRLAGHAEERRQAEANRSRLERDARAIDGLADQVDRVRNRIEALLAAQRDLHRRQIEAVRAGGARLEELRRRRSGAEHELAATRSRLQRVELDLAESAVRRQSVVETLERELGTGPDEAQAVPVPVLDGGTSVADRVAHLQAELERLGPVNPLALEELSGLTERHAFLEGQVEDVRRARRELQQVIRTLDEEIMRAFDAAFADVSHHFGELVSTLFPGGTGRISLTDPERLLDTGVEVEVRPAGRNVRRLSLLSGGERSLVAMAFLFAVFRSRPSPFYLMDEVEAALDDVNLHRFLGLVHEFRDEAQLIIVSHQKRTMESGDALYGVTMAPGGSSKVVSQKVPRPERAGGDGAGGDDTGEAGGDDRVDLVGEPAAGS
jgi:chromosome segregation protein